ncbi:MAG: hypothetical protein ATN33_08930 [Epulopiscium sp. Nele67-Bin001]|nr:MAG: hypothetical protein BEN18_09665 [Epulopiscium sp. Nuni2H_MBin001]OON91624.1 MAG: hypothetical protein ATN33_08930 [Epulopiscium sp. Nele67-Bin001]
MNETKAKIFSVMYDLMAEQGYEKTSTNQICELVGVKKPTLYYYFKTKEDLLIEFVKFYYCEAVNRDLLNYEITTKEQFKDYFYKLGTEIASADLKEKRILAEIRMLEHRIPSLKETTAKLLEQDSLKLIELGKSLGAINPSLNSYIVNILLGTVIEGIYSTILFYSDEVSTQELIQSWELFGELLLI